MNKVKLDELKKAKATLCSYCESDMCEWCTVERLISKAEEECETEEYLEEDCFERNYSPSCPWNAPGMSVSDFI